MLERIKSLKEFFTAHPNFFYNNGNGFQVNPDAFKNIADKKKK